MMSTWSKEDIESVLIQLNKCGLPFEKYEFIGLSEGLNLLGKGGYASVFEAVNRKNHEKKCAIKVIGFGDRHVDSESFQNVVTLQKELAQNQNNIIKIFDSVEIRVWIQGEHTVIKAKRKEENEGCEEGDYLDLQFIAMEKAVPVLECNRLGKPDIYPYKLASFQEKEIWKMAYDIGTALLMAHERKVLHRDIKLENIFYDPKKDVYKLGDFGIARMAEDGMVSTIAFTKGYGAPEVIGCQDDKYDNTADIYSYGMMLYVLLNELRFPDSNNYHVNVRRQYTEGYQVPRPKRGSDTFCKIVEKMCSFHPDDRYQSMNEVLNEMEKLTYGGSVKYKREHRYSNLAMGGVFALTGAVMWKVAFSSKILTDSWKFRWVAVWLLSLAFVLLFEYCMLAFRDKKILKVYFQSNTYWILVAVVYALVYLLGVSVGYAYSNVGDANLVIWTLSGKKMVALSSVLSWNPEYVGIAGMLFCLFWIGREKIVVMLETANL